MECLETVYNHRTLVYRLLAWEFFWPPGDHKVVLCTKILTDGRGKPHDNIEVFFVTCQQHVMSSSTWGRNATHLTV